jgi:hypothetical protein
LLTRLALRQGASEALAVEIAPHLARLARRMLPEAAGGGPFCNSNYDAYIYLYIYYIWYMIYGI